MTPLELPLALLRPGLPSPPAPLPLITLWPLLEADQGRPAGARCCRPKLNHGARGPQAQPWGPKLGPGQWKMRRSWPGGLERWLGPRGPASCLRGPLRAAGEAHLRGYRHQFQVWG